MNLVKGNINFTNEMLDGMTPGPAAKKNETVNDLVKTLTDMEPKLFTLIGKVENEDMMNVCLIVNDDLQKTFKRWHDIQEGKKPEPFQPGENLKPTVLAPTHIYQMSSTGDKEEEEEYYDEEEPAESAPQKKEPVVQRQTGQGGATAPKAQEPIPDLLDMMGNNQPAPAQTAPVAQPQQQQMFDFFTGSGPANAPAQSNQPQPAGMANMFDFGGAPPQQQQPVVQQQPAQPEPKKPVDPNDPLAALNDIMSKMSTNPQPAQQQPA